MPNRKTTRKPPRREHLEVLLDDALRMTFPASDPIAVDPPSRWARPEVSGDVAPQPRDKPRTGDGR